MLAIATLKQKRRRAPVGIISELADEVKLTFGPRAREPVTKLRVCNAKQTPGPGAMTPYLFGGVSPLPLVVACVSMDGVTSRART